MTIAPRAAFAGGPVSVRVPATSANLGPGFDALGLALDLYDDARAQVADHGLTIEVDGEGRGQVAADESHLVVRAMRATFAAIASQPPGLALSCVNRIPHGRGLGSSAAAIVAGALLARGLVVDGPDRLPDADLLALCAEVEGHPDNVAPCLLGGLTIAWTVDGRARAVRRDVDPGVVPVALIPSATASTELARGLLPATVAHADAAFTAGRAALLVAALTGSAHELFDATDDRLHQAYRAPAMADSALLVSRLRAESHAAVISGAGPTVLVFALDEDEVAAVAARAPDGWTVRASVVDSAGAQVQVHG